MRPETRYAKSGKVHIAYQVVGDGPLDLVLVPGWVTHLEYQWQEPLQARFLERLASFARLILFDKRGTGLSDRVAEDALPTLEVRMDDVRAVLDAAGSSRAALVGISEGGPMCALFAATYPERTAALVICGSYAKWMRDADYPWAPTRADHEAAFAAYEKGWGTSSVGLKIIAPSVASDERYRKFWADYMRTGASPGAGVALYRMNVEIDIRHVLPAIRVPTLILHRAGDRLIDVGCSRYMAERIPDAKYVELEGIDHLPWFGDADAMLAEIQEFLTGARPVSESNRILTTVMFADVAGSTERIAESGDAHWRELLAGYHSRANAEVERYRGRVLDTAGDGVFAAFDGPARAVRCAHAIREGVSNLGLTVRAGVHTGECEIAGDKLVGMAVHVAARISATATAGEVLVSSTVKDLVSGSGLQFADRGPHVLKGVPGEWRLFTALTGTRRTSSIG